MERLGVDGVGFDLAHVVGLDELANAFGRDAARPVEVHHGSEHARPGQLRRVDLEGRERPVHPRELDR
jgi:hypothetical protein